jgi:hypothetical protein
VRQLLFELLMHRPRAADQARGAGAQATGRQLCRRRRDDVGVTAQAEVVVAGKVEEGICGGEGLEVGGGAWGAAEGAEIAEARGGDARQGVQEALAPGGGFSGGRRFLGRGEAVGLGGGRGQEVPGVGTGAVWDGGGIAHE